MRPVHQFRTSRRCDRFDLVVRFHPDRVPSEVTTIGDQGELPTVNSVGEVEMSFRDTIPGRDYGIRWTPREPAENAAHRPTTVLGARTTTRCAHADCADEYVENAVVNGHASWTAHLGQTGS